MDADAIVDSMENAVANGVELLDQEYPAWRWHINLRYLDLGESDSCIIGQLYDEDYYGGLRNLGVADAGGYGFDLPHRARRYLDEQGERFYVAEANLYDTLTNLWKQEVER